MSAIISPIAALARLFVKVLTSVQQLFTGLYLTKGMTDMSISLVVESIKHAEYLVSHAAFIRKRREILLRAAIMVQQLRKLVEATL